MRGASCAALVDMKTRTRMVTRQLWLFTLSYKWIPSGRSFGQLNHISKSVFRTVSKTDPRLNPHKNTLNSNEKYVYSWAGTCGISNANLSNHI